MFNCLLVLAIALSANAQTDPNFRLNTPIVPQSYAIIITPYFDTGDANAFTFDGDVTIRFTTQNVINEIKLHSNDLIYSGENTTLTVGTTEIPLRATDPLIFDTNYTFAYINLGRDLQPGTVYTLNIVYRGPIRTDLTGFYRNYYIENGDKKWVGATQMEPVHARKVFPCFDEPSLKATFKLTIDRPASYRPSLSNTKIEGITTLSNGYVREVFHETPVMSSYLVAFLVSEFEAPNYYVNGTRELGIWSRPEATNQSAYAYDIGVKVVNALGEYFGIDYYSTNPNLKLDHVALPDFNAGAMENWGLVKYREALLLYVPEQSTPYYKYRVAQIVAHETTHMWFGNLVTCHWWSNTWLNEGFANYFQDYITSFVDPDVGSADILVTGSVYSAYEADDSERAVPINNENVNSPAEISGHFGTITYQKAGSVIRMMHHLLGDDAFRAGLRGYLLANQFSSGYPNLMYSALEDAVNATRALASYPGFTITDIMSSWIHQAGHPLLKVDVDYSTGRITLTQKRFYSRPPSTNSTSTYHIPITFTTGVAPNFNNTKPVFIMADETYSFNIANLEHNWIIFNVQETGLYRVNYDDMTWNHLIEALSSDRERIHPLNRAKIINDLFALFFADEVSFELVNSALNTLRGEDNYNVWLAAIRGLNRLRNRFIGSSAIVNIESSIRQIMDYGISEVGYAVSADEGTVALRNRMQILEFACNLGHTACVQNMVELFRNFRENGVEITPSLRPVAYCQGLKNGDSEDYEFLWRRMGTTNIANEARIIEDALGCSSSEEKLRQFLVSAQEAESPIRRQDINVPLSAVLAHHENVQLVLQDLNDNFDIWSSIYPSMDSPLNTIASALRTDAEFSQFETWLSSCTNCTASSINAAREGLSLARNITSWAEDHRADVLSAFGNSAVFTAPSINLLAIAAFVAVFFKL